MFPEKTAAGMFTGTGGAPRSRSACRTRGSTAVDGQVQVGEVHVDLRGRPFRKVHLRGVHPPCAACVSGRPPESSGNQGLSSLISLIGRQMGFARIAAVAAIWAGAVHAVDSVDPAELEAHRDYERQRAAAQSDPIQT